MKIKAYVSYDERTNTRSYREFDIVANLPTIGDFVSGGTWKGERHIVKDIIELEIDCEQGNFDVWDYEYYRIVLAFEELDENNNWVDSNDDDYEYIAIKRKFEELDEEA